MILQLILSAFIQCQDSMMHTVPIPRVDLVPKSSIKASYLLPGENIVANCKWNTARPTLNLDNFKQITEIDCLSDMIVVSFNSTASAARAFEAWSTVKKLAVMMGHEHRCKGIENVSTLSVKQIVQLDSQTMVIDTQPLDSDDLIDDFELDISEPIREKHTETFRSHTIDMNINYDPITRTVKRPLMSLFSFIKCNNCFVAGHAVMNLHIKSKGRMLQEYKFSMYGDIEANMDLKIKVPATLNRDLYRIPLLYLPATPLSVPGLFELGPVVRMDAGVAFGLQDQSEVGMGFQFKKKFEFTIQGKPFQIPKTNYTEIPLFTPHQPAQKHDLAVGVTAHMIPGIDFSLKVLQKTIFGASTDFDTSLAVKSGEIETNREQSSSLCTILKWIQNHAVNTKLLIGGVKTPTLPVWDTGDQLINCGYCQKCL